MATNTIVNGQTVVHKDSGGVVTTSPDVCKTPMGSSVVPIPYTNVAKSVDTSNGSKTVSVDGNPIMLKGSVFSVSTGDEPGTVGGTSSGVTKGKAKFVNYSFDVLVEGKPTCRRLDPMVSNLSASGNTPPAPLQQGNVGAEGIKAKKHVLSVAFVFKHPTVATGRVEQPRIKLPYTISGSETFKYKGGHDYVGVLLDVNAAGEYSFKFDQFDLANRPIVEKTSANFKDYHSAKR